MSSDPSLLLIPRIPSGDDPQPGTDAAIDYREMERWARYLRDSIWPIGIMRPIANPGPNVGWMICDGSAIQRIQYASLFNIIGTTYGPGDGSTTFNIPDLRGRVPMGSGTMSSGGTVNRVLGSIGGFDILAGVQGGSSFSVPLNFVPFTVVNYEIRVI